MNTEKRVNATAAETAITTTQPPKEYIVPNTIQYIVNHIKTNTLTSDERIEAQSYVRHLAIMAGELKKAHYIYHVDLAPKNELNTYECSAFADEGFKRSFDDNVIGVQPMSAGVVRRDWYDVEKDGYQAGKGSGNEHIHRTDQVPYYGTELDHVGDVETSLAALDSEYADMDKAANKWIAKVESAKTETDRLVALAGGISINKSFLL
jgi:hypothetical protein